MGFERIITCMAYFKGIRVRRYRWPHIDKYLATISAWPVYMGTAGDSYTHVHNFPAQIGQCFKSGTSEQIALMNIIDGGSSPHWQLPLPAWDPGLVESVVPHAGDSQIVVDRVEAALALMRHRHGLVNLMLNEGVHHIPDGENGVDIVPWHKLYQTSPDSPLARYLMAGICAVVEHLVSDWDREKAAEKLRVVIESANQEDSEGEGALNLLRTTGAGLRFMRDRICVPRDMGMYAARECRAHLNYVADILDPLRLGRPPRLQDSERKDQSPAHFKRFPVFPGQLCYFLKENNETKARLSKS